MKIALVLIATLLLLIGCAVTVPTPRVAYRFTSDKVNLYATYDCAKYPYVRLRGNYRYDTWYFCDYNQWTQIYTCQEILED